MPCITTETNRRHKMETILDLTDIKYSSYQDFKAYYMKFRFCVSSHLKKKGDRIHFLESEVLLEDETISPTFEDVILLWSLEKISPELPGQVKTTFGEQLTGNTTLKDLQEEIFKIVPVLLEGANWPFKDGEGYEPDGLDVDVIIKEEEEAYQAESSARFSDTNKDKDSDFKQKVKLKKKPLKRKNGSQERFAAVNKPEDETGTTCNVCGKVFEFKKQLYHHRRIHKIEHSVCLICDRTFKCRKYLVDHNYKHHRQAFKCDSCDMILPTKSRFDEHMRDSHGVHIPDQLEDSGGGDRLLNEDDFANGVPKRPRPATAKRDAASESYTRCDICDKNFADRSRLTTHMRTVHRELQPEHCVCEFCDRSFMCKKNLYSHKFKMHAVTLHCGFCDVGFDESDRDGFDRHMRGHTREELADAYLMCPNCGIVMHGKANFDEHAREHVAGDVFLDDFVVDPAELRNGDHDVDAVMPGVENLPSPPELDKQDEDDDVILPIPPDRNGQSFLNHLKLNGNS